MISPWRNPLPLEKYTTQQVVVYFYRGRWVPITFYSLIAAINLSRKAKQSGYERNIFPANLTPDQFEQDEPLMADLNPSALSLKSRPSLQQVG